MRHAAATLLVLLCSCELVTPFDGEPPDGDPACVPQCEPWGCGDDGCGSTCPCRDGTWCYDVSQQCVCSSGVRCIDACCAGSEVCTGEGTCCRPNCHGRECGPDGCGGSCGVCDDEVCDEVTRRCVCIPSCDGRGCGPDGCGDSCGECGPFESCNDGTCECDHETCGGVCCAAHEVCVEGTCACVPGCPGGPCRSAELATVCAGTFVMGSPLEEMGRYRDEVQHEVTLTHDYEILSTELRQADLRDFLGASHFAFENCGGDCPGENVDWHEAAAYCNHLSDEHGLDRCYDCTGEADVRCTPAAAYDTPYDCPGYRLPTEAEWEYAARAGDGRATYVGELDVADCSPSATFESIAWYCANSVVSYSPAADCPISGTGAACGTHPVAVLEPNPWGLYDMLGNVFEWCHDNYDDYPEGPVTDPYGPEGESFRVNRGGAWNMPASYARAARRNHQYPTDGGSNFGFRPVRTLR